MLVDAGSAAPAAKKPAGCKIKDIRVAATFSTVSLITTSDFLGFARAEPGIECPDKV